MRVVAAILAAGQGNRFGCDKTRILLGGRPVWDWSYQTYLSHPSVSEVLLVGNEANIEELGSAAILGGATRQESSRIAMEAASGADILLVHDAARPFVSQALISSVIDAVARDGAAAAAVPVSDTIKELADGSLRTLDRSRLWAMQTPQGAHWGLLRKAHQSATAECTDEMALLEAIGVNPTLVPGEQNNFKITTPEDLLRARSLLGGSEVRTGIGYDIHPFSKDPARALMLGGVSFPGAPGLEGHSDADVLLHAVTDAILGAAAMGDIGQHFPNTDPRWRGESSLVFLRHAAKLVANEGWRIVNLDVSLICEKPKVMPRSLEMREAIATAVGLEVGRIGMKATTNEGLGSLGRAEGIACFAIATLTR